MAKVFYNGYRDRIDAEEITIEEAIELAREEVPDRFGWRAAVIAMLEADL